LAVVAAAVVVDHPQNTNSKKKTILLWLNRNNECGSGGCGLRRLLRIRTRDDPGQHGSDCNCDGGCRMYTWILGVFFILLVVVVVVVSFVGNPMATKRRSDWDWDEVVVVVLGNCRFRILVIVVVHKAEGYILWLYGLLLVFIFC
jgi:hypothetical protein